MQLTEQKCEACRIGAPKVTPEEMGRLKPQIPDWQMTERGGIPMLERVYVFKEYAKAAAFTQKVAELAEAEGHHPAMLLEWGRVTVQWWTHKIQGLHRNDFICAAKTDGIYRGFTR